MKRWRILGLAVLCGAFVASVPAGADTFTGSLVYDTGLDATESWADSDYPTTLSWVVSENANGSWNYQYTFDTPGPGISHWIIELTDPVQDGDLFSFSGDFSATETQTHTAGPGNPHMPEDVYGIKFEWDNGGDAETISFDSSRLPVWQDTYIKCGGNVNTAWNLGFTSGDSDPTNAPADGTIDNHILAPNGYVPEPATTVLFGIGLAGIVGRKLRRRRED